MQGRDVLTMNAKSMIGGVAKKRGYRKVGSVYARDFTGYVVTLKIVKSRWSEEYFIDFGILFNEDRGQNQYPDPLYCNVMGRIRNLLSSTDKRFDHALNFSSVMEDADRLDVIDQLLSALERMIAPIGNKDQCAAFLRKNKLLERGIFYFDKPRHP